MQRPWGREWQKKARAALAMVRVRGDVGEVCRTRHEGASKPPGECFDCSPFVMEEKEMTWSDMIQNITQAAVRNADDGNTNFHVNLWYFLRIDLCKWKKWSKFMRILRSLSQPAFRMAVSSYPSQWKHPAESLPVLDPFFTKSLPVLEVEISISLFCLQFLEY